MISVSTTYTRPATDKLWYHTTWSAEQKEYVTRMYTNKLYAILEEDRTGLSITWHYMFLTSEYYTEWKDDLTLQAWASLKKEYNMSRGIVEGQPLVS
jgi:hypothetical protein